MAGQGDEIAASTEGLGHLRASHADREQAVNVVKAAFVQGLLAKDEFDLRIGQVLAARTYAQLAALTADIPVSPTAVRPLSEPARKSAGRKAVKAWAAGAAAFTGVSAVIAVANGSDVERLVFVIIFVPFAAMLVAMLLALHAWLDRRASRQSSQGLPPSRRTTPVPCG
jgi:heme A synthase